MSDRNRYAADWADTPTEAAAYHKAIDRHDDTFADQRTDAAYDTTPTLGDPLEWAALMQDAWGRLADELGEAS